MRHRLLTSAALLGMVLAAPAFAQTPANTATGARPGNIPGTGNSLPRSGQASNIDQQDTRSVIAPQLPVPPVGENASPRDFLQVADQALARGRTGEAQEALERAETRLLDMRANPGPANGQVSEINGPMLDRINRALLALGKHDVRGAREIVASTLGGNGGPETVGNAGRMNDGTGMNGANGASGMSDGGVGAGNMGNGTGAGGRVGAGTSM